MRNVFTLYAFLVIKTLISSYLSRGLGVERGSVIVTCNAKFDVKSLM